MGVPAAPAAFMSYVRFNDQHDDGQLSQFRERLSAEVRAQTGQEFAIFQDRNDIGWGQNWQDRIEEALDAATLLLVIITPSLFRSPPCRSEFQKFLERERELRRSDLILPVYYIGAREMDDPGIREADEMATVLASRQFADWRELRFEPLTAPLVRRAIAHLASRMRDTFWQRPAAAAGHPAAPAVRAAKPPADPGEQTGAAGPAIAKTEPPTHVVDAYERGDFATVSAAIRAARAGDRILVRPGLYEEGLIVTKPLEILGDGPVSEIEIRARVADVLVFRASIGRVANLTLRQAGTDPRWFGVNIVQGRLDLDGCDVSSQSLACVAIRDGADPRLRRNKIHGGASGGVFVLDGGLGTLEDNDIAGNVLAGVEIKTGGNPTLRRNQIRDGRSSGVFVQQGGLGTLEDNDITGNAYAGVLIESNGNPTVRGNRINRNGYEAVWIHSGGRGVVEDNDLTGNARGAWDVAADGETAVTRARNKE
ncbi:MAG TPA: right-handed parallel beta-helix repeat-containing protein [Streptosporangiaceae bacterium]|nr:right-handed parallel beta-helix repeat-containing protein [Streptosporangiaceae bacterium]